jgi:Ca-activated chloride channel homolog
LIQTEPEEQNMQRAWFAIVACAFTGLFIQGCGDVETTAKREMRWEQSSKEAIPKAYPVNHAAQAPLPPTTAKRQEPMQPAAQAADTRNEDALQRTYDRKFNTESYDAITENPFLSAHDNPLSTFSIDVDTASYALTRRFLRQGQLPPPGAVRIEELVNYFPYDYAPPKGDVPFSVNVELASCPWTSGHRLARIGLLGRKVHVKERPASNLVFLLDVSGSMSDANKLPLVQSSMKMLVDRLGKDDRVAIVVYAGASGIMLPSTRAIDRATIIDAINSLSASGSTNAGDGIQLAYKVAADNFIKGGVNRIILCTDGDFNVGITDQSQLVNLVAEKAKDGVALTVLGFGMGNYKDSMIEKLADRGNGNYAYIDTEGEAHKVLVDQLSGTLVTIAKDVKIQVDFNPARAAGYRLLGYENRLLRAEDFKDDNKDAGEIGAGHTVTAFYEIVPVGQSIPGADVDPSKYQGYAKLTDAAGGPELLTVRLRYKEPDGQTSKPFDVPVIDERKPFHSASGDFQFAASVAQFGLLLRDSKYRGDASLDGVFEVASANIGGDPNGYRAEFLELIKKARQLKHPGERVEGETSIEPRVFEGRHASVPPPMPGRRSGAIFGGRSRPVDTDSEVHFISDEHLLRISVICVLVIVLVIVERLRNRRILERDCIK